MWYDTFLVVFAVAVSLYACVVMIFGCWYIHSLLAKISRLEADLSFEKRKAPRRSRS